MGQNVTRTRSLLETRHAGVPLVQLLTKIQARAQRLLKHQVMMSGSPLFKNHQRIQNQATDARVRPLTRMRTQEPLRQTDGAKYQDRLTIRGTSSDKIPYANGEKDGLNVVVVVIVVEVMAIMVSQTHPMSMEMATRTATPLHTRRR